MKVFDIYGRQIYYQGGISAVDYLDDIGDVNVPTPTDDDILYWDDAAGAWKARAHEFVEASGTPVDNDIAKFTDANTIEGRSYAELKADLDLEIGTDVLAYGYAATHEAAADPHTGYQKESEKGAASGYASLGVTTKVVEQPASITDHLDGSPDEDDATKAPTSEWAFDHNAAKTGVHGAGASDLLLKSDVDDTPADGETDVPVSSNWAYDHAALGTAHQSNVLTITFIIGLLHIYPMAAHPIVITFTFSSFLDLATRNAPLDFICCITSSAADK